MAPVPTIPSMPWSAVSSTARPRRLFDQPRKPVCARATDDECNLLRRTVRRIARNFNRPRCENPTLQQLEDPGFLDVDHDQLIAYVKRSPDRYNTVIVVANLDSPAAHPGTLSLQAEHLELAADQTFTIHDLVTDARFGWSHRMYVSLDPIAGEPVHILEVESG